MPKLSEIARSGVFYVQHIENRGEETIRLKRLGICEQRKLEVLQTGDPMIVRVVGTRIGVSRDPQDRRPPDTARVAQAEVRLPVADSENVGCDPLCAEFRGRRIG